jgi:hypothetical protein
MIRSVAIKRISYPRCRFSCHTTATAWNRSSYSINGAPTKATGATATTTADAETAKLQDLTFVAASKRPTAIFPWRHESEPLEWVREGQQFGKNWIRLNRLGAFAMTHGTAINHLNVPWYEVIFSGWKQELANSGAWAFSQAVAGVISNTYSVPFESIVIQDGEFDIDFQHTIKTSSKGDADADADETIIDTTDESKINIDDMIEENLKELYQSAHASGRQNLQITLQTKPVGAKFMSCFWIPYLTRQEVKTKPAMRRCFHNVRAQIESELEALEAPSTMDAYKLIMRELEEFSKRQTTDNEHYSTVESTVVALIQVECDEVFSVVDLETQQVLQGHADQKVRRVQHVVRLEQVTKWIMHDTQGFYVENGPWQITDWDDLLDGNIFFM